LIELHALECSDDGLRLFLAAHPKAESPGYFLDMTSPTLQKILRDLASDKSPEDPAGVEVQEERAPSAVPLSEGPIEVGSPAEALEAAQGLCLAREGTGLSDLPLRDAVHVNLSKWNVCVGQEVLDEGWWVAKLGDHAWQISFRFLSRGRIHEAEWMLDTERVQLNPENSIAAVLGWVKQASARPRVNRRRRGRGRPRRNAKRK